MTQNPFPAFNFTLLSQTRTRFAPRLGNATIKRSDGISVVVNTPGLLTSTSRGVVPHLSRDHVRGSKAIRWVHLPFESFLDTTPPIPTLQTGVNPLHRFFGFSPSEHVISMSLRDPSDCREMPANGKDHVAGYCIRGVRKVSPKEWRSHIQGVKPDFVVALSDVPFTTPPYSQKRLTKCLERSNAWLADILQHPVDASTFRPNVFVHMAGDVRPDARCAFSEGLLEVLHGREADAVKPFKCLEEGVSGYVFDMAALRLSVLAEEVAPVDETLSQSSKFVDAMVPLLKASLEPLGHSKIRLMNSSLAPHEILRFIQQIGIDVFDAHWAQHAANIGVALDFQFPPPSAPLTTPLNLGHNLYDPRYAQDFSRLSDCLVDAQTAAQLTNSDTTLVCACLACSPIAPSSHIIHSTLDNQCYPEDTPSSSSPTYLPHCTRAYVHHLLHTHEMSSHTLLVMHNLSVLEAFFAGIRKTLALPGGEKVFNAACQRFLHIYDGELKIFDEAKKAWTEVELARGKGRLAREKVKEDSWNTATDV